MPSQNILLPFSFASCQNTPNPGYSIEWPHWGFLIAWNVFNQSFCGVQERFFQKEPLAAGGKEYFSFMEIYDIIPNIGCKT